MPVLSLVPVVRWWLALVRAVVEALDAAADRLRDLPPYPTAGSPPAPPAPPAVE